MADGHGPDTAPKRGPNQPTSPNAISSAERGVQLDANDVNVVGRKSRDRTLVNLLDQASSEELTRVTVKFAGTKRNYYVFLPQDFDAEKFYWPLVTVHGGGGNGKSHFLANGIRQEINRQGLEAIVISPSFTNKDFQASRFPHLGEGAFLDVVLKDVRSKYQLREKILITGYSRGGQFCHRFALRSPKLVAAAAPCAAGTWTTPDGHLWMEGVGEVTNPQAYLSETSDLSKVPERLHGMFIPRVAAVAGLKAEPGSKSVPFLVMCGTLDTRYDIAKAFANNLKGSGYQVQTHWPRTPHGERSKPEYRLEFEKYPREVVRFFQSVVTQKK